LVGAEEREGEGGREKEVVIYRGIGMEWEFSWCLPVCVLWILHSEGWLYLVYEKGRVGVREFEFFFHNLKNMSRKEKCV